MTDSSFSRGDEISPVEENSGEILVVDEAAVGDEFVPAKSSRTFELVVALTCVSLSLVFLYLVRQIPSREISSDVVGPQWWPNMLGISALVLSLVLTAFALFRSPFDRSEMAAPTRTGFVRVTATVLLVATYFWAWPNVGFIPSTGVLILALVALFGARGWKMLILFPAGITFFLYGLFHWLLRVPL